MRRVQIVSPARRPVPSRWFELFGSAVLGRRRVELLSFTCGRRSVPLRLLSPQRLIHDRDT